MRDKTSTLRHRAPGCAVCRVELHRAGTGRRRRYCGGACRQRAWRLRDEARRRRGAATSEADPAEVTRLLAAVLGLAAERRLHRPPNLSFPGHIDRTIAGD